MYFNPSLLHGETVIRQPGLCLIYILKIPQKATLWSRDSQSFQVSGLLVALATKDPNLPPLGPEPKVGPDQGRVYLFWGAKMSHGWSRQTWAQLTGRFDGDLKSGSRYLQGRSFMAESRW